MAARSSIDAAPRAVSDSPSASTRSNAGPARSERFRADDRIKRRADFVRLQGQGRRRSTKHFVVVWRANELGHNRLGVAVSRKVGKAVQRNRVKRVLREVFRRNRSFFPDSSDVLIIARRGSHELGYQQALAELRLVCGVRE